ncbi:MAG: hypothetical protein U0Q07_04630 [Acidimicrobiales bacterium]
MTRPAGSPDTGDAAADSTAPSVPVPATGPAWRRAWVAVRRPVGLYLAVGAVLWVVSALSVHLLSPITAYDQGPGRFPGDAVLDGWLRFDGNWYRIIAADGYSYTPGQQSPVAFFPGYPLAVRAASWVVGDPVVAGVVVSVLCGLAVACLFWRWSLRRADPPVARIALALLLLWPYAWYLYGAVYGDALFLVAVLVAFVLVERGHPVLAGLAGAVATATRPVGLAVVVGLVAIVLEQRGVVRLAALDRWRTARAAAAGRPSGLRLLAPDRRGPLRPGDAGVLLSLGGLAAWSAYLWSRWGDPFLFATVQGSPGWDQAAGPHTWFKVTWFQQGKNLPGWLAEAWTSSGPGADQAWTKAVYAGGVLLQGLLVLGAIALVPVILRRLGWGYALYTLAVVGIPLIGSKDFQGTGRYLLAAFPCFVVLADLLAGRRRLRATVLVVSALLLVLWTSAFARGSYVA